MRDHDADQSPGVAAGHDDRLVLDQPSEPLVVDGPARAKQEILDGNRRQAGNIAFLAERRQPADLQAQLAAPRKNGLRLGFGLECRGRHDDTLDRAAPLGKVRDHVFELVYGAKDRNPAYRLTNVGGRRRQQTDRPQVLDRAALDRTQENFGIGGAADHDDRGRIVSLDVNKGAPVAEIPIGKARGREQEYLQEPVQYDRLLSEKERAVEIGRDDDVVEDKHDK